MKKQYVSISVGNDSKLLLALVPSEAAALDAELVAEAPNPALQAVGVFESLSKGSKLKVSYSCANDDRAERCIPPKA